MIDLSHWEFAERFSGYDAAALILGVEPRESETERYRIEVVTNRMAHDYQNAMNKTQLEFCRDRGDRHHLGHVDPLIELVSVRLHKLRHGYSHFDEVTSPSEFFGNDFKSEFENQEFSRSTILSWLETTGMKAVYRFDRGQVGDQPNPKSRWPWGAHHTANLEHLEAAARRFWVGYDPSDATTANTNTTVIEWLQTERKVSGKMAEAIATMLRPDGLPTGPRKIT